MTEKNRNGEPPEGAAIRGKIQEMSAFMNQ